MAFKGSKDIKTLTSPSPSKPSKKSKLSAPMSCSSSSSPHQLTPNRPHKRARATALPSTSSQSSQASLSSHSAAEETVSGSASPHQGGYDIQELLKAVYAFRLRNGIAPTMVRCIPDFFKEVRDFIPKGLSENQLLYKLYHIRDKFRREPRPGPDCADSDRSLYELGMKAWGPRRLRAKRNASGSVKRSGNADGLKNKRKGAKESENEEDDDTRWEEEESMELGNDKESEAESPYMYLKHALENFWIAKNLDLNVLQLALQKVDSVQAKLLDQQFMEIAKDELKLKIKKNKLSNDIINVLCTGVKRSLGKTTASPPSSSNPSSFFTTPTASGMAGDNNQLLHHLRSLFLLIGAALTPPS